MKILFLTYDLPYPLVTGGKIRAYHLLKALAKDHQVTLFSYYRKEEQKKYLPELKKHCSSIQLFPRRQPWSLENLFFALTHFWLPFVVATYYSADFQKALLQKIKAFNYDLVHFESFYPALWLPLVKKCGLPVVMGNENLEYLIYQRFSQKKPFFIRWLLNFEVRRMKLFEEKLWQQADINLAVSQTDAVQIKKITGQDCVIIPNGVKITGSIGPKIPVNRESLLFIGTLLYQANNETMKYFLSQIYPLIKQQNPPVKFILVSGFRPEWLKKHLADPSINFIQDNNSPPAKFFAQADVLVVPMCVGSGSRIKILEAMAAGLPVVTTSIGIEGIEAIPGKEVIVADDPKEFAQKVNQLLKNPSRRQLLVSAAQKMVQEKYDWNKIGEKLNQAYQDFYAKV
jgi:glycosyltransferase involved in cell wall biosynthesis